MNSIKSSAFKDCTSLIAVKLSNKLTELDYGLFSGCTSLLYIVIPDETSIKKLTYRSYYSDSSTTLGSF